MKHPVMIITLFLTVSTILSLGIMGCQNTASSNINASISELVVVIGLDQSASTSDYRKVDTAFVAAVCRIVAKTGGVVVFYGIGDQTEKSGERLYLRRLCPIDNNAILSKQAEQTQQRKEDDAHNKRETQAFLATVQTHLERSPSTNTDLNGFFRKADVLMAEPQHINRKKIVFCYSDGVQSLYGVDKNASYRFKETAGLLLCLAGWKTKNPSGEVETVRFEDTAGFLEYITLTTH